MQATEFRIGNLVNYTTAEGDVLQNFIDWQDLKWLSEDEKGFNLVHSFIPLTESIFYDLGFLIFALYNQRNLVFVRKTVKNGEIIFTIFDREIKYVHELQNWYFLLTGEELILSN
jgi:hypothetical protein